MPRLDEHVLIGLAMHRQQLDPAEYKRFLHGGPLPHPELEYICQECQAVFKATTPRRRCPNGHTIDGQRPTMEVELSDGVRYPAHPVLLMPAPAEMRRVDDPPPPVQVFGNEDPPMLADGDSSFDAAFHGFLSGLWVVASQAQGFGAIPDPHIRRQTVQSYLEHNQTLEDKRTFFMNYCSRCAGNVPAAQEWLFGAAAAWALNAEDHMISDTLATRVGTLPADVRLRIANWAAQQPQWRIVLAAARVGDHPALPDAEVVYEIVSEVSSPRAGFERQHMNEPPAPAATQWQTSLEYYSRTVEEQAQIFNRPSDFVDFARGFLEATGTLTRNYDGSLVRLVDADYLNLRYHEGQLMVFLEQHEAVRDLVDLLRQGFEVLTHSEEPAPDRTYFYYGMAFCSFLNRITLPENPEYEQLYITQLRELAWTKAPFWFEVDGQGNDWTALTLRQCPHPDANQATGLMRYYPSEMQTSEMRMAWDGYVMGLMVTAVVAPDVEIDFRTINYVEFLHYVTRRVSCSPGDAAVLANIQQVATADLTRPGQVSNPAQAGYVLALMQNNWPVQGWMTGMPGQAAPDTISYSSCWLRVYPRAVTEVPAAVLCRSQYPSNGNLPGYHVFMDGYLAAMQLHVLNEDDERVFPSDDGNRAFLFDTLRRIRFDLLQEIHDECMTVYQSVAEDVLDHDLHLHDVGMSFFYARNHISTPDIDEWNARLWQESSINWREIWATQFQPFWVRYAEQPSSPVLMQSSYPTIELLADDPSTVAERMQQFEQDFLRGYLYELGFHISERLPSRFADWEDSYHDAADAVVGLFSDEPLFNPLCDEVCAFANRYQHLMPSVHLTPFENGRMFWRAAAGRDAGLWTDPSCQNGLLRALSVDRTTRITLVFDDNTWAISIEDNPRLPLLMLTDDPGFNAFWDGYIHSLASFAVCGNDDNDDSTCPLLGMDPNLEIAAQAVASTGDFYAVLRDAWCFYQDHCQYFENRESAAGHAFNMTRNGHGVGFWDGGWDHLGDNAEGTPGATVLTDACEQYDSCQLEWRFDDPEAAERAVDGEYENDPLNYDFLILN